MDQRYGERLDEATAENESPRVTQQLNEGRARTHPLLHAAHIDAFAVY